MPVQFSVSLAYDEVYDDYKKVDIKKLISDIPTSMALVITCHYTAQVHTSEEDTNLQLKTLKQWSERFNKKTIEKLNKAFNKITQNGRASFNFINNVTSMLTIEFLIENKNDLPQVENLTAEQEEDLFKLYLYFSAKWTKEQEDGIKKYNKGEEMALVMLLPFSEVFHTKDFRLQFLKAIYFFKFCEESETFKTFLDAFLTVRGLNSWNEYLFNLVSVYVLLLDKNGSKSVLEFNEESKDVFNSLTQFCINPVGFESKMDFLSLRSHPLYRLSENEILFLNINFFVDKIYQGIMFDFADILIKAQIEFNGNPIKNRQQFFGIFGDNFIESGMFFKAMRYTFRQKDYQHFTGDILKQKFGDGAPDYLIVDNRKLYVFEFKNTFFSGPVKYSFSLDEVKKELNKKFVENEQGKPKGVTQLINFCEDFANNRYKEILPHDNLTYIIYPSLLVTDYTFNLPVLYKIIYERFKEILKSRNIAKYKLEIKPLNLIDFDLFLKFQDMFISRKLTLNHIFNDYQIFLNRGDNPIDRSLSFHKYLHNKTSRIKYDSPKIFMKEIEEHLFD